MISHLIECMTEQAWLCYRRKIHTTGFCLPYSFCCTWPAGTLSSLGFLQKRAHALQRLHVVD